MAQEGFYKNPILINQATHRNVKVAKINNFTFANAINSVLVTGHEFMEVCKHYPIVFVSGQNDDLIPLAILGLREKANRFVDDEGKWKEGCYIPSFIRRYPFILAENDASGENFAVSVDADYEGFDAEEGIPLFDEEGNPSENMNKIVDYLKQFQMQNMVTREFVKKLKEYNLFKEYTADITMPAGEKVGFSGLKMIDEKAVLELDDEKALDLYRRGFMAWIYANLFSLTNFRALATREAKESTEKAAA